MGMGLIGAMWTTRTDITPDHDAISAMIDAVPADYLLKHVEDFDESGGRDWEPLKDDDGALITTGQEGEENAGITDEIRSALKNGARAALGGVRLSNSWGLSGTGLVATFAGGGSWGDDPFDEYADLVMFIDSLHLFPEILEASGVVCGGLPHADTVQQAREEYDRRQARAAYDEHVNQTTQHEEN